MESSNSMAINDLLNRLFSITLPSLIIFSLIILLIYGTIYFFFQLFIYRFDFKNRLKLIYQKGIYALFGIVISILLLIIIYFFNEKLNLYLNINNRILFIFEVMIITIISTRFSFFTSLSSLTTLLVAYIINFVNNSSFMIKENLLIQILIPVILSFVIFIYRFFFEFSLRSWFLIINLIIFICFIIYFILDNNNLYLNSFIETLYFLIYISLFSNSSIVIFHNIYRVIENTYSLKKSIFKDGVFIKEQHAKDAIFDFAKENNANYILVMKINILGIDQISKQVGNYIGNKIEKTITNNFIKSLNNDLLFLRNKYNENIICMKLNSISKNDIINVNNGGIIDNQELFNIVEKIKDLPIDIKYNSHSFQIKPIICSSIYGIHSCDIYELFKNIKMIENNYDLNKNNNLIIFNGNDDLYLNDIKDLNWLKRSNIYTNNVEFNFINKNGKLIYSPKYNSELIESIRNVNFYAVKLFSSINQKEKNCFLKMIFDEKMLSNKIYIKHLVRVLNDNKLSPSNIIVSFINSRKNLNLQEIIKSKD